MSPVFSNPEPQQFLESIRKLEARLSSLERTLHPGGPSSLGLGAQSLPEVISQIEARLSGLEKVLDPNGNGFSLVAGSSSITVNKTGVVIKSQDINLIASGRISVKAGGEISLKGAKITEN